MKEETLKYLETMITQLYKNLWDAAKTVLRGKFIAIEAFLKNRKNSK